MSDGPVLGIDTSGAAGSVALFGSEPELADEVRFTKGLIHGVALAPAVAALLGRHGALSSGLSLVAVGTGPGSYTGVRVGVSFAKSLAFAAGVPVVGVPSLDAIADAAPAGDGPVVVVRDARRGTLYFAVYRGGPARRRVGEIRLVARERLAEELPPGALVLGDAVERYGDFLSGEGRTLGDPASARSPALSVARIGIRVAAAEGPVLAHDLAPIYLRPSEAEEKWESRRSAP